MCRRVSYRAAGGAHRFSWIAGLWPPWTRSSQMWCPMRPVDVFCRSDCPYHQVAFASNAFLLRPCETQDRRRKALRSSCTPSVVSPGEPAQSLHSYEQVDAQARDSVTTDSNFRHGIVLQRSSTTMSSRCRRVFSVWLAPQRLEMKSTRLQFTWGLAR